MTGMEEIGKYELLRNYQAREEAIEAINKEIESVYGHVPSPSVFREPSGRQNNESPTEKKLRRVEALNRKKAKLEAIQEECEDYVLELEDFRISTILRYRYLMGYTWETVAMEILGSPSYQSLIRTVNKYYKEKQQV